MSPESSALLQLSNQREKTVRVYSDGVPERDCPWRDASSRFNARGKLIKQASETKTPRETPSGRAAEGI
jgi:hypothetical protein